MDDLSGLDWSSTTGKPAPKAPSIPAGANYYGSMQQTPSPFLSGRNTPLSAQATQQTTPTPPPAKAAAAAPTKTAPAADSFSNLLNFGGPAKSTANLSLREQQERLEAEKRRKAEEQRKNAASHFGNGQFLDALGSGSGSGSRNASPSLAAPPRHPPAPQNGSKANDDDDLFAAFNSETKVDNASHYPPPPDLSDPSAWGQPGASSSKAGLGDDDDDPFGLNQIKSKAPAPVLHTADDDDFLGDLGKPVEEVRRKQPTPPQPSAPEPGKPIEGPDSSSEDEAPPRPPRGAAAQQQPDEFDRAVEQLTGYGFSEEDAQRGLTESGAGLNVQAAANWLLDDAHRRAKAKAQGREPSPSRPIQRREGASRDASRRGDNRSPANEDLARSASAMGSSIFKTANSLWKTGKKQVAQAYAEFNQDGDPNQPKWMRSAQTDHHQPPRRPAVEKDVTDEAMMLEGGGRPERRGTPRAAASTPRHEPERQSSRGPPQPGSTASSGRSTPVPRWQQPSGPMIPDSRSRASKLAAEDDASTYVSPNRRRRPAAAQPAAPPQEEPDLLFNSRAPEPKASLPQRPAPQTRPAQPASRPSPQPTPKPTPRPARQIPAVSSVAVQQSTKHRLAGTQHFKRGDYAAAHASYSNSLSGIPDNHPLVIVLLTNRALTSLKTGEPKKAVEDSDAAIKVIGPSGGQGEQVSVVGETGAEEQRDMRDLYGKALSRKAEALEQMERWSDAGAVWQVAVEAGVSGSTAIAGRQRCQNALAPKPKPKPSGAAAPVRRPAATRPPATTAAAAKGSSEAVERLRKQNIAAAAEDDEKFALSEKVDARIAAWRDGKRDNLRALLGSLDTVLWENSGWKKVGLHEVVMANKVKIVYMKAIAKTHPDKVRCAEPRRDESRANTWYSCPRTQAPRCGSSRRLCLRHSTRAGTSSRRRTGCEETQQRGLTHITQGEGTAPIWAWGAGRHTETPSGLFRKSP